MAGGGQWEVVGGGKAKKTKTKGNKASAKEKTNGAPAFEASAPIQESHTIYTALLEKPPAPPKVIDSSRDKGPPPPKKKKGGDKKTPSKVTLEEVFAAVSEEDLKNHLATLEVLYPATPHLWLKDLASFLNVKVDVPTEEPALASRPTGYPSNLLNKAVHKKIVGIFSRCTPQMLQIFYEFCLQSLVQDTLKGLHTMGYRVMLQLVAHATPSVALASLNKCSELCQSHQNRQNICLSVLWAAGQAGNSDLEAGFRVWLELMFPLIGAKNCTAYIVDYLEKLTRMDGSVGGRCSKSLVDVRDLFPILDFIHCKDVGKGMQKRLLALYPTLKKLSYGSEPETTLRNYFPSYLRRLEPQCPQPLKEEILDSLMLCLEKDERCYSIWRQLYTKHFVQSKLLISHLNDQWSGVPPKFPRRCLRDTLSVFQVTNEELLSSGRRNLQDVEECTLVNKELLSKINAGSFSWQRFVLIAILVISSLLTCDILVHGSFADSVSGKLMKDYGLLVVFAQAGEKLTYFYGRFQTLVQQYYPPAYQWLCTTLGPLLDLLFRKVCSGAAIAWDATSDLRSWCSRALPPLLALAEGVFVTYGTALRNALGEAAVVLSKHLLNAFSVLLDSAESLALWMQTNPQIVTSQPFCSERGENQFGRRGEFINIVGHQLSVQRKCLWTSGLLDST